MHNNNTYYLRAITAEKELEIALDRGRALWKENAALSQNHVYALKVIEDMGTTMQSRRHRFATWIGRIVRAQEMKPGALDAMLVGIRGALDGLPSPQPPSADEAPTPPASEPDADPAPPGPRLVIGGRDA